MQSTVGAELRKPNQGSVAWEGALDLGAESLHGHLHPVWPTLPPTVGSFPAGQAVTLPAVSWHHPPGTEAQHWHLDCTAGIGVPYGTFATPGAGGISILPVLACIGLGSK